MVLTLKVDRGPMLKRHCCIELQNHEWKSDKLYAPLRRLHSKQTFLCERALRSVPACWLVGFEWVEVRGQLRGGGGLGKGAQRYWLQRVARDTGRSVKALTNNCFVNRKHKLKLYISICICNWPHVCAFIPSAPAHHLLIACETRASIQHPDHSQRAERTH